MKQEAIRSIQLKKLNQKGLSNYLNTLIVKIMKKRYLITE